MEGRLVVLLTNRDDELAEGQRRIEGMVDRLALMYLIHTPEVPEELRDGAVVTARRRYANYLRAVERKLANEDPQAEGATASQETASDARRT
jgi:hypothetical protein